jgi:hypothetical protein
MGKCRSVGLCGVVSAIPSTPQPGGVTYCPFFMRDSRTCRWNSIDFGLSFPVSFSGDGASLALVSRSARIFEDISESRESW